MIKYLRMVHKNLNQWFRIGYPSYVEIFVKSDTLFEFFFNELVFFTWFVILLADIYFTRFNDEYRKKAFRWFTLLCTLHPPLYQTYNTPIHTLYSLQYLPYTLYPLCTPPHKSSSPPLPPTKLNLYTL